MDSEVLTQPARERGWAATRDSLLANPRFQRWAMAFPPARWVARRWARSLFDLCAGFVYSQVLAACLRLNLFEILAEGPQDLPALGHRLGLDEKAARCLLDAAMSLDLVSARRGSYRLGRLGAALRANPGIAAMVEHHRLLYADLADPVSLLRGEPGSRQLASYWPYAEKNERDALETPAVAPYTALMATSQAMIAAEVLHAYDIRRHAHLMDVGGGNGAFLRAAGAHAPGLHLSLFDLPPVAEQARLRFARSGIANAVTVSGGDFQADPLPRGADLVTLVRVLHDHDDDVALALLRAVHQALAPGATLLVAEPMAATPGAEPVGHAYFGFYLLAMGRGRPRTALELAGMLGEAGFSRVREHPTGLPMVARVLTATA